MVLGGAVKVVRSESLKTSGPQTEGMIRMNGISDMSDQICGTSAYSLLLSHNHPSHSHSHSPLPPNTTPIQSANITNHIVMIAKPHTSSAVHHHGAEAVLCAPSFFFFFLFPFAPPSPPLLSPPLPIPPSTNQHQRHPLTPSTHSPTDTLIYAVSGHGGAILSDNGRTRHALAPGDFALVPAFAQHQEINDGGDDVVVWVIARGGREPVVVNLDGGWGQELRRKSDGDGGGGGASHRKDSGAGSEGGGGGGGGCDGGREDVGRRRL
ncbi:mannose-6-phosphate isomerase [Diplodia corticola]|uniref:Mannose-6-phosphate isomerase n=1 Tax=Diplodia corticola TaxID=236234 RepID=A0A1J9SB75_9PEZI|nr:mannose-6-phosphate isomerase [Diplodia corticola]OJD36837.1 mannose-6-phosphate isomerase [Diplodia corticola]